MSETIERPSDTPLTNTQNDYGYSWNWCEFARGLERDMERYRLTTLKQDAEIMCLRAELEDERAECLEQARLNAMGAEREAALLGKIEIMRKVLEEIASYDNGSVHGSGICHYGCDTPYIAQLALYKTGHHTDPDSKS
jgi:hypothetical protein